ncbi:MAG: PA2778 family cysteine peptidase [Polaromonas sp.]|nr:PA2778 family cysteine peptidase [Polaromonas sp.]
MSQLARDFPISTSGTAGTAAVEGSSAAAIQPKFALPKVASVPGVPFFPQDDFQCGPAALAMLAQHAGVNVLPDELTEQVYVPGRQGSFQVEMLTATRRQALVAYTLQPQLEDLLREVASGNPVLVFQNLSLQVYPIWHYAVVIGFDRARNTVVLHSGVTERLEMSLFTFERTWARGEHWAMVALPPERLPATAQAERFTAAAAGLERVQPAAAQVAYRTALKAWPGQRAAMIGLGNAAYALGQKEEAAARFESATQAHADFADAWNNLAQVRLEQGRLPEAAEAIKRAVQIGGPRAERYSNLQEKILAKLKSPASAQRP